VVSQFFWFVATFDVVLSFGFAVLMRRRSRPDTLATHRALARSQEKDNWLACVVVWAVIFSEGCPIRPALFVLGAMILAWLARRALFRVRSLQSSY
jgi:hypothetical protein